MSTKIVTPNNLKKFRQQTDQKYVIEGEYSPKTSVGWSDNLTPYGPNSGTNDGTPFLFRTSGGNCDIGSKAYLKELRGNSQKIVQLIDDPTLKLYGDANIEGWTIGGNPNISRTSKDNVKLTFTSSNIFLEPNHDYLVAGHTYAIKIVFKTNKPVNLFVTPGLETSSLAPTPFDAGYHSYWINYGQPTSGFGNLFFLHFVKYEDPTAIEIIGINFFDLTLMYGGINNLQIEKVKADLSEPYYECEKASYGCKSRAYQIVGYNAFGGSLKKGWWIDGDTGEEENDGDIRSAVTNFIKVVPGQNYTAEVEFDDDGNTINGDVMTWYYDVEHNLIGYNLGEYPTVPSNCCYVKVGFSCIEELDVSKTHFCFHLTWDNSKVGYEEYKQKTYSLPNVELRSLGGYYDKITPDGTLTRNIKKVELADKDFYVPETGDIIYCEIREFEDEPYKEEELVEVDGIPQSDSGSVPEFYFDDTTRLAFRFPQAMRTAMDMDLADYVALLKKSCIYYVLETPEVTQSDDYKFEDLTDIDDWGTQEFIEQSLYPVSQGNFFFYITDYRAFLDTLSNLAEQDASNIALTKDVKTPKNLNNVNHNNKFKNFVTLKGGEICSKFNINYLFNKGKYAHFHNGSWAPASQCWGKPFGNCDVSYPLFEDGIEAVPIYGMPSNQAIETAEIQSITYDDFLMNYIFPGLETLENANIKDLSGGLKFLRPVERLFMGTFIYDDTNRGAEAGDNGVVNPFLDYFIKDGAVQVTQGYTTFRVAGRKMIKFCPANQANTPISRIIANEWLDLQIIITGNSTDEPDNTATIYIGLSKRTFR